MKKKIVEKVVIKNTSIRLSDVDRSRLDFIRDTISPHVRVSDNKAISAALKIAHEKLGGK